MRLRNTAVLIFFIAPFTFAVNAKADGCTQDQAFNKMMAIGRASSRMMAAGNVTTESPAIKLTTESASISQLLADKKYDEACVKYDQLAAKYKIDLKKESEGLVTMEDIKKDGGKRGGSCTQAEASIKLMNFHQQLEDKAALGDVDRAVFTKFGQDTAPLNELMYTNPSEVCRRLDGLKKKYGVN